MATAYETAVLADSPAAFWHLGEAVGNFPDLTGHGNNMSATGTSPVRAQPSLVPGNPDGSLQVSPTSAAGMGGTSATTDLGDIWSIEAWIKRGDQATQAQYLVSKPNGGYGMYLQNNNLCAVRASTAVLAASTITIDQNVHHCVVTKNGAAVKVYVDGVDVTGTVTNSTCTNTGYWLALGNDNGANPVTSVLMDEVAIYPTALALSRVQAHYVAGLNPPAYRASGAFAVNGSGTPTINYPAGVQAGDLLFIHYSAFTNVTPTTPAGWTKILDRVAIGSGNNFAYIYIKIATGSEPASITFANTGGNNFASGIMSAYTGVDPNTPINVSATAALPTSGTAGSCPSVTTTRAGTMLLHLYWNFSNSATVTPDAADTERYDTFESNSNTGFEMADRVQGAVGATGTSSATFSTATSGGLSGTFALNPIPSGGGGGAAGSRMMRGLG